MPRKFNLYNIYITELKEKRNWCRLVKLNFFSRRDWWFWTDIVFLPSYERSDWRLSLSSPPQRPDDRTGMRRRAACRRPEIHVVRVSGAGSRYAFALKAVPPFYLLCCTNPRSRRALKADPRCPCIRPGRRRTKPSSRSARNEHNVTHTCTIRFERLSR